VRWKFCIAFGHPRAQAEMQAGRPDVMDRELPSGRGALRGNMRCLPRRWLRCETMQHDAHADSSWFQALPACKCCSGITFCLYVSYMKVLRPMCDARNSTKLESRTDRQTDRRSHS
jgi:hypothetical protein